MIFGINLETQSMKPDNWPFPWGHGPDFQPTMIGVNMKVKTAELTGIVLDWAVAKCEGLLHNDGTVSDYWQPSELWEQGGPIIEREGIELLCETLGFRWVAIPQKGIEWRGSTPLEAAMRCYVASKLGDEIEVPDELVNP